MKKSRCGQEFTIPPYQQMFYTNRGWELPKRCKACREKKKQERQKKEAEEATRQFEKELSDSPYAIRGVSNIEVKSPVTTLYVIGNGFDLAHGVPSSYSKFRDWLGKPGAKYLNFNYTEFAETLYGAKGVCYIHESRKNRKAKLILGHSYKKYVSDVSVKMPRFKDGFKRGIVNAAFDDAMVHAGWYDQATTKNSRQIIKEHESFFDGLSDIDTVIVIGHSHSKVDMEYFERICSEIHSDAKWIFSCHDSAGLKAINAFVKTMDIGADRVTLIRL